MASVTIPVGGNDEMVYEDTEGIEPISSFDEMGLHEDILRSIYYFGFEKPSAIQQRAIMPIIEGRNVIAQGQSGTGITSMIAITVCQLVDTSIREVQALYLTPCRNLAARTQRIISSIGHYININPYACVRGPNDFIELEEVGGVHVVCGTPNRIHLLLSLSAISTESIRLLLLDEPDEHYLQQQLPILLNILPPDIQVVLVSSTLPTKLLLETTSELSTVPVKILLKRDDELPMEQIEQHFVPVQSGASKFDTLLGVLDTVIFTKAVILCTTMRQVDLLTEKMRNNGFSVSTVRGGMSFSETDANMSEFSQGTTKFMIKEAIQVPGLDELLEQVPLLINYDLTDHINSYIHRIGSRGVTLYIMEGDEIEIVRNIEQYYTTHIGPLPVTLHTLV